MNTGTPSSILASSSSSSPDLVASSRHHQSPAPWPLLRGRQRDQVVPDLAAAGRRRPVTLSPPRRASLSFFFSLSLPPLPFSSLSCRTDPCGHPLLASCLHHWRGSPPRPHALDPAGGRGRSKHGGCWGGVRVWCPIHWGLGFGWRGLGARRVEGVVLCATREELTTRQRDSRDSMRRTGKGHQQNLTQSRESDAEPTSHGPRKSTAR